MKTLKIFLSVILFTTMAKPATSVAADDFESLVKSSEHTQTLSRIFYPFVATCEREKDRFRRLFCSALNDRLVAQHQSKTYRTTFSPSAAGPLIVKFSAKPKPTLELRVKGCLTCKAPMHARKGGDISKSRFFMLKMPDKIKVRRGRVRYDFGNIDITRYEVPLPARMTKKKFKEEVLPFLRLDLLFKPIAGVTKVGKRHKYGVINFELVAHRVYDRCSGKIFGAAPPMKGKFKVNKKDLSCPQNQPKKAMVKVKLPSQLPRAKVQVLMKHLSADLQVCYEQFGVTGEVPVDNKIAPKGIVKQVKEGGKLAGTPSSQCVERMIKALKFPRFSGPDARLQWPLSLKP